MGEDYIIGVDLDNTIINFDELFSHVAFKYNYINSKDIRGKKFIRNIVRTLPDGEKKWQEVQRVRICKSWKEINEYFFGKN
jgi:hypothetical protein